MKTAPIPRCPPPQTLAPSIPKGVRGKERAAFTQLFKAGADGVITTREAQAFAARNKDLFTKGDNRWIRSAVKELVRPGTTYAYYNTPDAKLTAGAKKELEALSAPDAWVR
jgi:hypothetical protein